MSGFIKDVIVFAWQFWIFVLSIVLAGCAIAIALVAAALIFIAEFLDDVSAAMAEESGDTHDA